MPETNFKKTEVMPGLVTEIKEHLEYCMLQDQVRLGSRLRQVRRSRARRTKDLLRIKKEAVDSSRLRQKRAGLVRPMEYPDALPIVDRREEIIRLIKENPVVVVAGETGSGKTTQLPKMCLEAGRGIGAKIACTQPRRVAALSVSRRIAEEMGVVWGREVGCKIRFRDQTAPETLVKMMTDGMLLAEVQNDPELLEYDTVIIDEAHERSLNIDFLLGYLRRLRETRPDLKVIITSATIDTEAFSEAFGGAPIVEVSGRMYPVEVIFRPPEELLGEQDDFTYIDAAVEAVQEVMETSQRGDILLFMPSEKDIHETRRRLEGRRFRHTEVLPLFGRLTATEQQRVFSQQQFRRVVVATNIAETSLTIPGIRYVVDTGLARISRYNPRTQTQRLPIEAISQSSARQREGRCGRLEGGVCIRLYSEQEFESRTEYTQPEIQRANLAEVILRMMALKLGDVESFPFIDPPRPQSIQGGFLLLKELGALDAQNSLTQMGRDMSRLPISPTISRMVLHAEKEGAVREVLVIAAAISIQDPRIRPEGEEKQAEQAHGRFRNKDSDFLSLLKIWDEFHDTLEKMKTQRSVRKFCKSHYLSYNRMREWRDIHTQLRQSVREIDGFQMHQDPADYDAIHRSVISGLLSNVAQKKEGNHYRAARGRDVMIFPGSGLFNHKVTGKSAEVDDKTPPWIVAAEMVETSRLFARTVSRVQPDWLAELGAHLCTSTYKDPFWNNRSARVMVTETLTLYGLQVHKRRVGYGKVDPVAATEIFVREALVNQEIRTRHKFLEHNEALRRTIEAWQIQKRQYEWLDVDEAVYRFYAGHLDGVSSIHDLNRVVKQNLETDPKFLFMTEADLVGEKEVDHDAGAFPDQIEMDGQALALSYSFRPGQADDGVTVKVPYKLVHFVRPEMLDWLVPGLLQEKIVHLLRGLPKTKRKQFVPVPESAKRIAVDLRPTQESFLGALEHHIKERFGVDVARSDWSNDPLPDHLQMRVEVVGNKGRSVVAGRDLEVLTSELDRHDTPEESKAWSKALAKWKSGELRGWSCGDLPERVEVTEIGGVPVYGFPGLGKEGEQVVVCLYKIREDAKRLSKEGLVSLYEFELKRELSGLRSDLRRLDQLNLLYQPFGSIEDLREHALNHLEGHIFERPVFPLTEAAFLSCAEEARDRLKGLASRFAERLEEVLSHYRELTLMPGAYPGMDQDIARLLPPGFLQEIPYARLGDVVRYIKALSRRAERAKLDPGKDHQKRQQVEYYQDQLDELSMGEGVGSLGGKSSLEEFRWMLEEYRVSVFAQELGTNQPISQKRLDTKLEEIAAAG
jgi:ATP-dependent helicase HrpA